MKTNHLPWKASIVLLARADHVESSTGPQRTPYGPSNLALMGMIIAFGSKVKTTAELPQSSLARLASPDGRERERIL